MMQTLHALQARPWTDLGRVLAVRLDNLGDLLMTTPALSALRSGLPDARITLLASPSSAAAAAHLPIVDEVWPFAAPWVQHPATAQDEGHELGQYEARLVDRLAEEGFDAAVIFTVCTQSALPAALLCRLAGIPRRLAHSRENPYGLLSHWVPDTDQVVSGTVVDALAPRHEVARQLALVASVGLHGSDDRLRFEVLATHRCQLVDRLHEAGIDAHRPYAVLHPGATAASRRWPAERFGQVGQALLEAGCAGVFSGSKAEMPLCQAGLEPCAQRVRQDATALSLAGLLCLGELAALIEGASVLITNNSAPAHLAAALQLLRPTGGLLQRVCAGPLSM
jgi:ADP-heptose:LPS heptosyltransferase